MTSSTEVPEKTTPLSRREANVASRRKLILESARTLLAEAGQDGLSMRKLAKEAGLSVTTLYNLVGSREDILRALIEDSAERFESTVTLSESIGDSLVRTMKAFDSVLDHLVADAAALKPLIVANIATGFGEELRKQEHSLFLRGARNTVRQSLLDALADGQIRDVVSLEFLEGQFYASLELALDRWAYGLVDEDELRVKGLWGAYLTLLAVASPESRPQLESQLQKLEEQGRAAMRSRERRQTAKSDTAPRPGEHDWTS